jgi:putative addiction module CopG family antidote
MSVIIPPEFQPFVIDGIASGRFRSEAEAVKEGLNLLRSREQRLDAVPKDIQIGLDDLEAGPVFPT